MKRYLITLSALAIFTAPSLCSAAPGRPGPYFSAFLGASLARDASVSTNDAVTNNSFNDLVEFDPGVYVGGTGGYDFGFLRLEGELSYRHAEIKSVTDSTGFKFRSVDGSLGAFATMFNVFFDLHNSSPVTPYLGGGIGFATMHLTDTHAFDTRGGTGNVLLYGKSDDTVFASQVGAGVDIAFNSHSSLDVGYRYFMTDKANFDSNFSTTSSLRLETHNAMVGFKFKF